MHSLEILSIIDILNIFVNIVFIFLKIVRDCVTLIARRSDVYSSDVSFESVKKFLLTSMTCKTLRE